MPHGRLSAVRPSQRYTQHANLLMEFRNAYVALINHVEPTGDRWSVRHLEPRAGTAVQTWSRLRSDVARAAGAASTVYPKYGGTYTLRNAAYILHDVDPVANWEMSLRDPEQLRPETVLSTVEGAIALALQRATEAEQRERGLTGLIAAFLRWPANLREAVGPGHGAQRTAAGVLGVVGQIVVGVITTALGAAVVAGAVALWKLVF